MGMHTFEHIAVTSLQDAVAQVGKHRKAAAVVAGGTDILGILKDEVRPVYPRVLVDLKRIKGLDSIVEESGGIRIGALTTLAAITKHKAIRENYPLLADAAHAVASPQLRNMGTIGGNICQEPRCWYYRHLDNVFHCLRKGGEKCPALTGENRFHSIYGSMRVGSPGCCQGCPDNIDIPRYMERIRAGEIAEAGHIILEHNPMPAVTGRVCPHFCEQGCNRNEQDSAVSVRAVERRVGDYVLENAKAYAGSRVKENGRKVAIVGGGPAGLTCAYFLRKAGFGVTLYDKQPKLGGMLRYGIPDFRLSQGVLDKEIDFLLSQGITAKTGQRLGKDFTLDSLKRDGFKAVFLAMGSWTARGMGIENEKHANILPGISFLESVKWNGPPTLNGTVAVVGGGNTAIDAARTARRCGAKKVVLLYRRTRAEMPAEEEEIEDAVKEGIELQFLVAPKKAVVRDGRLVGLECCRMKLGEADASGRPRPVEVKGSEFLFEADWVVSAIGQDQNLLGLANKSFGIDPPDQGEHRRRGFDDVPDERGRRVRRRRRRHRAGDRGRGDRRRSESRRVDRGVPRGRDRPEDGCTEGRDGTAAPHQRRCAQELRAGQRAGGGAVPALHGQRGLRDARRRQGRPRGPSLPRLQLRRRQRVGRSTRPRRPRGDDHHHAADDRRRGLLHRRR